MILFPLLTSPTRLILLCNGGANIIHIAACHPTQTGVAPDLFARAVKQCQESGSQLTIP
ncbi:hypothetical protein PN485_09770 [Nodularia spumigena CS-588/05]|nr:hypothetical protein [Nodularia spumigena CS-588/01]MDB9352284.1 hypothetical protein [Nodularia spumigena CS-588/05]